MVLNNEMSRSYYDNDMGVAFSDVVYSKEVKSYFNIGNIIKYIQRAGLKNVDTFEEDLKKADWYFDSLLIELKEDGKKAEVLKELKRELEVLQIFLNNSSSQAWPLTKRAVIRRKLKKIGEELNE